MTFTRHPIGESILDHYEIAQQLGKGAFSVVKLGRNLADNKEYAIKIIKKPSSSDESKLKPIITEIEILSRINHPNVVKLHEVFETEEEIYLVLQLITGGELFEKIVELKDYYTETYASKVVKQILEGLAALHENSIVHRDLKPENLLLSDKSVDADVLITDFGLSAIIPEGGFVYDAVGTPSYIAPEILITLDTDPVVGYRTEVDVWGVGVICYILLCGFPPFFGEDEDEIYDQIEVGDYDFPSPYWDPISEEAKDFVSQLLTLDGKKRPTVAQALTHPWIASVETKYSHSLDKAREELAKFNAKRKFKGAITGLLAVQKLTNALAKGTPTLAQSTGSTKKIGRAHV